MTFCPNFKVFSFDFSEEIKCIETTQNVLNFGVRQRWSQESFFLKTAFYYQFWFYTQNDKLSRKSYEACNTLLSLSLPSSAG